jgi:GH24 family phage-related lysozyme (muramidase)
MPVRYDIAAQVPQAPSAGIDPLNMMAQLRAQEYQQAQLARMAQSMDVQDMQARLAAQRELRQAEAAQRQAGLYGTQQEELLQKMHNEKVNSYKGIFQNFVNDQKSLDNFVGLVKRDLPELAAAFEGKKYSDDWKLGLLNPEKAAELRKPEIVVIDGNPFFKTKEGLTPAPVIEPGTAAAPMAAAPMAEGMPGARQDMTTELIKQREGFTEKPKYDVNAYRAGYGSDTVTLPDGTVQKVTPGTRVSREDAERDLQRRLQTEFVPRAAAKVGEENWARLPENTRAALTSIAYNYGTIPSRLVPAVQSGNPEEIARAIEGLAGDNKGINASRRMQEADIARGAAVAPPVNALAGAAPVANAMAAPVPTAPARPMTVAEYKQKPLKESNSRFFNQLLQSYEEQEKAGVLPTTTEGGFKRAGKILETTTGELGRAVTRVVDPKAQELRDKTRGLIDQYIDRLRSSGSLTGGEANTVAELEAKKAMLGSGNMTIGAIRGIIKSLDENIGLGKLKVDGGSVTVNVPGMGAVPFPSREAAEAFKREAGLQ